MNRLAQPAVLVAAAKAAFITALLCYPRFALWLHRPNPVWYLEVILFLGSTILWGFVFAWHSAYSRCPVFKAQVGARLWGLATAAGLVVAGLLHLFLDQSLRLTTPEDYPANLAQWLAMTLFQLAFVQLFLVFAPFAWSIRLVHHRATAAAITILLGVLVLMLKTQSSDVPLPASLFASLFILRIVLGLLMIALYLRGGVTLVWWCSFLIEARHLLDMH